MKTLSSHALDANTEHAVFAFLERINDKFPVQRAILFGSRARGNFGTDSDADLAVLLSGPKGHFMSAVTQMSDASFDVMLDTGIIVEALPIWIDEWENQNQYSNPDIIRHIKHDGIIVQ